MGTYAVANKPPACSAPKVSVRGGEGIGFLQVVGSGYFAEAGVGRRALPHLLYFGSKR